MKTIQDHIDAAYPTGNQRDAGFLREQDYHGCADLDASYARKWLEDRGYEVIASGDLGTNGIAVTKCGWNLSTNGFVYYDPHAALRHVAELQERQGA